MVKMGTSEVRATGVATEREATGAGAPTAAARRPFAYLVSRYPAYNHTFILREIRTLRARGFDLRVASVSEADRPPERMTDEEREEAAATFCIKSVGATGALAALGRTIARRPLTLARAVFAASALAGPDPRRLASYALYCAEAIVFGDWMRREGLDHFHTHFSSTVGLIAARAFGLRMSMTLHGPAEFDDPAGFHLAEKIAASTFACGISNYGRSQMMLNSSNEHWDRLEVASLGIDPTVFEPRPPRDRPPPFQIVCVGRLAAVKAQHVLVDAIASLVASGRDVRLRLVGDGPDRTSLERAVAEKGLAGRVAFEGWQNQDAVLDIYREADAFALASFAEGVPVVLMEAMAMEIPCVATRITGVPELIRDGVDGLLVAPSDADELARAIARLVDDPALGRELGRAGRRRVLERYDLEKNVARLATIFDERLVTDNAVSTETRLSR
jgi:colanic acid/amylovoran biosynthesis glycosyltransferase